MKNDFWIVIVTLMPSNIEKRLSQLIPQGDYLYLKLKPPDCFLM
jgi:hypothetical protein